MPFLSSQLPADGHNGLQNGNKFTIIIKLTMASNNYPLTRIYYSRIELLVFPIPAEFTFHSVHIIKSQYAFCQDTHIRLATTRYMCSRLYFVQNK